MDRITTVPLRSDQWPEGAVILRCAGALDLATQAPLADALDDLRRRPVSPVVVDLTEVTHLDCASHRLLEQARADRDPCSPWVLVCRDAPLLGVLDMLGLASLGGADAVAPTLAEALERLEVPSSSREPLMGADPVAVRGVQEQGDQVPARLAPAGWTLHRQDRAIVRAAARLRRRTAVAIISA